MKLLCERVKAERAKQDEAAEDRAKDSSNLTLNTWPHFSSPHSARRPSGLFLPFRPLRRRFPSLLFHAPCDARPLCSCVSSFLLSSIRFPRAPAYRFRSFSTAFVGLDGGERSCEVMISVTQFLALSFEEGTSWSLEIRVSRKCRWIWSRNFFSFFLEITFLEQSCVVLFSCNWNNFNNF